MFSKDMKNLKETSLIYIKNLFEFKTYRFIFEFIVEVVLKKFINVL